jgi:hypothetical protein
MMPMGEGVVSGPWGRYLGTCTFANQMSAGVVCSDSLDCLHEHFNYFTTLNLLNTPNFCIILNLYFEI